jgi:hypothetical protein
MGVGVEDGRGALWGDRRQTALVRLLVLPGVCLDRGSDRSHRFALLRVILLGVLVLALFGATAEGHKDDDREDHAHCKGRGDDDPRQRVPPRATS